MPLPLRSRRGVRLVLFFAILALFSLGHHRYSKDADGDAELSDWPSPHQSSASDAEPHLRLSPQRPFISTSKEPSIEKQEWIDPIPTPVLGKHTYRPDGLLEVNEEGPHPIYELISRAQQQWEAKLEGASTTLDEAVAEYKRRYNRAPPKGFDLWWKYAIDNNVQLPDEYDQIFQDLEGFWGLEPKDLIAIHEENEKKIDSYTVGKNESGGDVDVLTYAFQEGRYDQLIVGSRDIVKLFRQIQDYLPPFRMTLSPHDGPNRLTDYGVMEATLKAAAAKRHISVNDLPKTKNIGWISACPPDSPARTVKIDLDNPPPLPSKKTFIHDHVQTMDPCIHPEHFYHHGQFLSHNYGPSPQSALVPEFSYCSTTIHHNIRFPVPYGWVEDIYPRKDDPEWDDKLDERLLWRGSATGMYHGKNARWRNSHRDHLVSFTNDLNGTLSVLPPDRKPGERIETMREVKKALLNPAVMDIAFGGTPNGCPPEVCEEMERIYPWRDWQSIKEAGNYKYVVDMDGNGWSGRFKRLMTSNSLIFKSTIYPEWYADRIAPWVHYVPIQVDLTDLHDALLFFRGDANGDGAHEEMAKKIAAAGREWSKTFWRKEDLISYLFRLTLEYARLMSEDREAMNYRG
ncbi:hypothetical protein CPC08DRAFT_742417 [Agrocybe pediades]|nr:hypothetical protein CPC08DRAFT_742417 [Agrocybe pediades]